MTENVDENLRGTLSDIGTRLPQYGKLSARLIADGRMSSRKSDPLMGMLGAGGLAASRLTRMIPMLGYAQQAVVTIGAIRFALGEMQADKADQHLREVGLTRQQVEADYQTITNITKRFAADGTSIASRLVEDGAHVASHLVEDGARAANYLADDGARKAGRAAGKGVRAFRRWQSSWSSSEPEEDR